MEKERVFLIREKESDGKDFIFQTIVEAHCRPFAWKKFKTMMINNVLVSQNVHDYTVTELFESDAHTE